jgi:dTDP-4-amino-4,6-dideoxygalactose transaminase
MDKIQMVDLLGQYKKIKPEVDAEMQKVIDQTAFINGPQVKEFAQDLAEYLNVKHVIPCGNGTDALQIALMALDLKPGDEVITPDFTFIATVEVVKLLGLKPVLVDVDPELYTMDTEKLKEAITPKTKAIVPVHLYGQCANMEEIMQVASQNNLHVVEDVAQAIGSDYYFRNGKTVKAGTIGDIGCTSFFPSKNLGAFGDGGAMFTHDDDLAEKMRMIVNHGSKVKYYHQVTGVNSRLDTLQAALLKVKLRYLDKYNQARQQAAAIYDELFEDVDGVKTPKRAAYSNHIFHQYTLLLNKDIDRDALKAFLAERKVPSMVYYPVPMHQQEAFLEDVAGDGLFPVSNELVDRVLSLPMHTELTREQQVYIAKHVKEGISLQDKR